MNGFSGISNRINECQQQQQQLALFRYNEQFLIVDDQKKIQQK